MRRLSIHSPAKINLSLKIIGRRKDGFHDIETVFQSVSLQDNIDIAFVGRGIRIECDRDDIPVGNRNIVSKAIALLKREGFRIPGMRISIEKNIPPGSGLGGGSSNAAGILMALNDLLQLRMDFARMNSIASSLGSDVPFFLWGGTAAGRGKGNEIFSLADLPTYWIALATFQEKIDTAIAYASIDSLLTEEQNNNNIARFIYSISRGNPDFSFAENDFERYALGHIAHAGEVRRIFREQGAELAILTGSGSAVYGLFKHRNQAQKAVSCVLSKNLCEQCTLCTTLTSIEYYGSLFRET